MPGININISSSILQILILWGYMGMLYWMGYNTCITGIWKKVFK